MKTGLFSICFVFILFFLIYKNLRFIKKTHYIKLKVSKNYKYKHIEGVPTHYAHLINNLICPLLKYRNTYGVNTIYMYVPSNYNEKFKKIINTILPFVHLISDRSIKYDTINVKSTNIKDLKDLNLYSHNLFVNKSLSKRKYILLINRGTDNSSTEFDIINDNGVYRRSIKNFKNLEKHLLTFCKFHNLELKKVILENLEIENQIMLFKYASIIIAQHGASLVNTVWCNNCELVIEYNSFDNMWYRKFHQFSNKWIVDTYRNNHIYVNIPHTISLLENTLL